MQLKSWDASTDQMQTILYVCTAARRSVECANQSQTWPVSHIVDTANLYVSILQNILSSHSIGYGKNGYYLAASGSIAWNDIYCAMAKGLAKRNVIHTETVDLASEQALEGMGQALGCPKEMVPLFLGGQCSLEAHRGHEIGWEPQYPAEHILEVADEEVGVILEAQSRSAQ